MTYMERVSTYHKGVFKLAIDKMKQQWEGVAWGFINELEWYFPKHHVMTMVPQLWARYPKNEKKEFHK